MIRIARIFRDIPVANITVGLRHLICAKYVKNYGRKWRILCMYSKYREIKSLDYRDEDIQFQITPYQGSYNDDYFICAYVKQPYGHIDGNIKLGFIRLRLKKNREKAIEYVDEIQGCAIIVFSFMYIGRMRPTYMSLIETETETQNNNYQHRINKS